jgi:RNA polymerase-binding transcription factor DksA
VPNDGDSMAQSTKKTTTKKASAVKRPAKTAAKNAAKKAPAKKGSATNSTAKKAPKKKATAKKAPTKKTAKTATVNKTAAKTTAKKAPAKKAPKSPFGQRFLASQRELLIRERAKYVESAETLKAEADALVESREPGDVQFDEESGEGDTLAVERERDLALSAHARAAVEQIDAALTRIDKGVYGVCVISGLAIPKERLEAIPWAAERVEYKAGGLGRR